MIPLHEAQALVADQAWRLPAERVPLDAALHRVLAEDVHADLDMPPFDKAAVDGYACRLADATAPLEVIEIVPAGQAPTHPVGPGQCSKVMTGAPLPEGADGVIMVEHTAPEGDRHIRHTGQPLRPNRCLRAEDMRAGDRVLRAGTLLHPQHLAVLATVGAVTPLVARIIRIGVLATGSELVPAGETPRTAQIRNSNSPQLTAQVRTLGHRATDYGIAPDEPGPLGEALQRALGENDIVLTTGGVSMGDFDLIPDLATAAGLTTHLRKVAIQPGKPIVFATGNETAFFGLSGNPMSCLVQFELFVRPFLARLQGTALHPVEVALPLSKAIRRKLLDRMSFVPVAIADGHAVPLEYHGSAHINALTRADGLVAYPIGAEALEAGAIVPVRLLRTWKENIS